MKNKITQFIDKKGISKLQFYRQTGLSNGFLDKNFSFSVDNLVKILNAYPELNKDWILFDKGKMLVSPTEQISSLKSDKKVDIQEVPIYELKASAGIRQNLQQISTLIPIDHMIISSMPKCDGGIVVYGDSFYPLIRNGDTVFYKEVPKDYNTIMWGNTYLISYALHGEDYFVMKYVQKSDISKEYIKLASYNKHHEPFDIPFDSIIDMAIVKASFQRYFY